MEIDLTPTQERIYDSYADAFQIIHNNLYKALEACNISGAKTYNTAFMGDEKQILIFSNAGGTGRSYHADLNVVNRRRRSHYLLEAGWRADNAIQDWNSSADLENPTEQKQSSISIAN